MVSENEIATSGGDALDKELNGRISSHNIRCLLRCGRWKLQRFDATAVFALDFQQFTARREKMDSFGFLKELLRDRSRCLYHVFAVIQDDEESSCTNEIDELQARVV